MAIAAISAAVSQVGVANPAPVMAQPLPQRALDPQGRGRAIVFIGGFGDEISGIMHHLANAMPKLSPDSPETRAYFHWSLGRPDDLEAGMKALIAQIKTYRRYNPGADVILIGHSMGAATALKAASRLSPSQGAVYLVTLDPVDRSTMPERPASVTWWGNSFVRNSQSGHDFIASLGGRWNDCAKADLNLPYDGRVTDERGRPYIHDAAAALLLSRGNEKGISLLDALRTRIKGQQSPTGEASTGI